MALFAIAPELTAMDVGVAVGTLSSAICKNKRYMTLAAIEPSMLSPYRKWSFIVIKIRPRSKRTPAGR